ncbi:DNA recombination protein RmuC [Tersicoccus sp. MR15.9]|uniref:DNA recombination protein RmuC n=1 Tax=Tersicoccus mangrovi TaxID=3121635 RepID=UPI002FE5E984
MDVLAALLLALLTLVVGLVAGVVVGRRHAGTADDGGPRVNQLTADLARAREACHQLEARAMAADERSREQLDVLQALAPVQAKLSAVEEHVRVMERQRAEQYGGIHEALRDARTANGELQVATQSLAGALRSTSARGTWGEAQLRRVVEAAGMLPHVDFGEQVHGERVDADGQRITQRPDMVVALPGGKELVLDAKAPLSSYLEAQEAETEEEQAAWLSRHAKAVRAHVDALGAKKYWEGRSESPELVLCFLPAESALSAALTADGTLLDHAASRHVALVSPVSLLAALKAVSFSWRQESLTDNARELFVLAQQLYDRLGSTGKHLATMGSSLRRTVETYNSLVGSMENRVFVTARRIADLDPAVVRSEHLTPEGVETTPRTLTAVEFLSHDAADDDGRERRELGRTG